MISASHNPYHDNGIKIFNRHGEKISEVIEEEIEQFIDNPFPLEKTKQGIIVDGNHLATQYIDFLVQQAQFKEPNSKILIDCANGSVSYIIESLVTKLGIKADYIHHQPNGKNINDHCGATHLDSLKHALKKDHYSIGIAFDGDGDRMIAVLPNGYIVDGDVQIFIHALLMKKAQTLNNNQVVLTVMSNLGLKTALRKEGISVIDVPVGDRFVQQGLKNHQLNLGGEQSGHVMFYDLLNTGSGLLSMVRILNILFIDNGLTLSQMIHKLEIFPQCLKNISVRNKEQIMKNSLLIKRIQMIESNLHEAGRILVRASGTEPLIRVMVEAKTFQICEDTVNEIIELIYQIETKGE
jgi:phosphoglucosamine mutase